MNELELQTPASPSVMADWRGGTQSLYDEYSYAIDQIEGSIPPDLYGTLFRNGAGLLDIGGVPLKHPFDGDGMVCAFTFKEGQAHFRNRFVRTQGYVAEQKAGKILYRGFGTLKPGGWLANAFDFRIKNVANTNIPYWGDRLLALWEAGRPYRLDPATLETLEEDSLGGVLPVGASFAAHPKIDPGDMQRPPRLVNFAASPGLLTRIRLYELDLAGQVVEQAAEAVPGFAFMHDFAITPNYCLFFQSPLQFNPFPFVFGLRGPGECLQFQPRQATRIWILPRHGQGKMLSLKAPACFVFHHANAYEEDGQLIVESIVYNSFPNLEPDQNYRDVDFAVLPPGQLWRFQLDLTRKSVKSQVLVSRSCEFPMIHPRRVGQKHRYVYLAIADSPEGNAPLQGLLKLDLLTGQQQIWSAAPKGFIGEPVLIPRGLKPGVPPWAATTSEDDGWLAALVYDANQHRSYLAILDAADLTRGPVARLHLKHHIPYGLHGCFINQIFDQQGGSG